MMAQYLNPSKICLLAIAAVYCEGCVPPTATIAVLSLVNSQQLPVRPLTSHSGPGDRPRGIVELAEIKAVLDIHQCARSPKSLWEQYLAILHKISNIDMLFDFFASLKQLFVSRDDPDGAVLLVISKTSLLGGFVRRSQIEFEKLNFQDAIRLWESFTRFSSPSMSLPRAYQNELKHLDTKFGGRIAAVLKHAEDDQPLESHQDYDHSQVSCYDAERFLDAQHQQMREFESRPPHELTREFVDLKHPSPQAAGASYYLKFLSASLSGDYSTSFEFLHRYYDYDMRLRSGQSFYQFALLSTALLQADLGCYGEAIKALNETVAVARENKDTWCLIFTLHWLYYIQNIIDKDVIGSGSKGILESDVKSLAFLKAKAIENRAWSIASATLLREAQLGLSQGRPPYEALERVHEAASMNVHHQMWPEVTSQNLQQSAIYARLGVTALSSSYCALTTDASPRAALTREKLLARCRTAYAALLSGDLKTAQKLMTDTKPSAPHSLPIQQIAKSFNGVLNLKISLFRNDLKKAEQILTALNESPIPDPDLSFQVSLLRIDYFSRIGDFRAAYGHIEQLSRSDEGSTLAMGSKTRDIGQGIQLLLAKAKLFISFNASQKAFSITLRASVAAFEARVLPLLWQSIALLSKIMIAVGGIDEAKRLLDSVIWQVEETGDCELMALLQSAYTDVKIAVAGRIKNDHQARKEPLRHALQWVDRACQSFTKIEDSLGRREMTAKAAVILRLLGDLPGAAAKANAFATAT